MMRNISTMNQKKKHTPSENIHLRIATQKKWERK